MLKSRFYPNNITPTNFFVKEANKKNYYYLTGGCVFIIYVILLKLKQVYNMSRSQNCPLCCRGGERMFSSLLLSRL